MISSFYETILVFFGVMRSSLTKVYNLLTLPMDIVTLNGFMMRNPSLLKGLFGAIRWRSSMMSDLNSPGHINFQSRARSKYIFVFGLKWRTLLDSIHWKYLSCRPKIPEQDAIDIK